MKAQPIYVEILFKYSIILIMIALPTFCIYSGYENGQYEKLRRMPTAENIQRWQSRKFEYLQSLTCEALLDEVESFKRNGTFCSRSLESIILIRKKYFMDKTSPWFDAVRIPDQYISMDEINLNENNIKCQENILEIWKTCPTGYTYAK